MKLTIKMLKRSDIVEINVVGLGKTKRFYKFIKLFLVKYSTNTLYLLWGLVLYSDISLIRYISKGLMSYFVTFSLYM